jgi:hypothetical protein
MISGCSEITNITYNDLDEAKEAIDVFFANLHK